MRLGSFGSKGAGPGEAGVRAALLQKGRWLPVHNSSQSRTKLSSQSRTNFLLSDPPGQPL